MQKHPQIAELYKLYLSETQPFRKVHRLIDLFESIIKTHTVLIVSEYVQHNKLSEAAKGLLAQGLRTPSLGTWQLFSRVLFSELAKEGFNGFFPSFEMEFVLCDQELYSQLSKGKIEFSAFDKKQIAELKKQKKKRQFFFDDVIAFRNGIAHGATPNDEDCLEDIKKFDPYLHQLLEMQWLKDSALRYKNTKVFMSGADSEICLHPLIIYKDEGDKPPFAFFNDLKNDKIGLLNYPLSKHYREKDFWNEFHEYLPLHDWKKTGNNEFYQRIEELTETFKGRTLERANLLSFVKEKNKGYCSVQGNPGIGKSALIAQFFKDVKADNDTNSIQVIEYFIRRGTAQAQVEYLLNYLIKKTDEVFPAGREIRAEGKTVFDLQHLLFSKWRHWAETGKGKLLFLIDGIDEGIENNVANYLPRENFINILFIYGSRPGGHATIDKLWGELPTEHHQKIELSGLSKEDIRALIYEVANKYEIERESAWIDAVQKRSQGNPLYLKLLCDAIENGSIALNDIKALPKEIEEYYKAIIDRYATDHDADALLHALYSIAAAKDYLTMPHLGLINYIGVAALHRIGSTLKEVLYENPLTEEVLDYQLFHESFREYLYNKKGKQVQDASERIIDFCSDWKDLEASYEQRYALEHYAPHLSESKKEARITELIALSRNESYIRTQKKVLKSFAATNRLFQLSLLKASDNNDYDAQLESALSLIDLKYEEANDAPQIIEMVANGEIDLALKRIESFGGNDKEGLQPKFILYMLCLMELTLLDSKEKTHRKKSIERLLNDLDEKMPVDHSVLNWNDFFPSYLMFQMACVWTVMGVDYLVVYKRTEDWDSEWITEKGPYTELQFGVLKESASGISEKKQKKSNVLKSISIELSKQGILHQAILLVSEIEDLYLRTEAQKEIFIETSKQGRYIEGIEGAKDIRFLYMKSGALVSISTILHNQKKYVESSIIQNEAIESARMLRDNYWKSFSLKDISSELFKNGNIETATELLEESLECAYSIMEDHNKNIAFEHISIELAKQGNIDKAIEVINLIHNDFYQQSALNNIAINFVKIGKIKEALFFTFNFRTEKVMIRSAAELAKQGKGAEALNYVNREITSPKDKVLIEISIQLAKKSKIIESLDYFGKINSDISGWEYALHLISGELTKLGMIDELYALFLNLSHSAKSTSTLIKSIFLNMELSNESHRRLFFYKFLDKRVGQLNVVSKISIMIPLSTQLKRRKKQKESLHLFQKTLTLAFSLGNWKKILISARIAEHFISLNMLKEAQNLIEENPSEYHKSKTYALISYELAKQGEQNKAIDYTKRISDEILRSATLASISTEFSKQGKIEESISILQEALSTVRLINSETKKSMALSELSTEFSEQGKIEESISILQEALGTVRRINSETEKSIALAKLSTEFSKQKMFNEAKLILREAIECSNSIKDDKAKSESYNAISIENAKQGNIEALNYINEINSNYWKANALARIPIEFAKLGKIEDALNSAFSIIDEDDKSSALKLIAVKLVEQANYPLSEKTGSEIPRIAKRHRCWKSIAKSLKELQGWEKSLELRKEFKSEEAILYYLKGWAESISLEDMSAELIQKALPILLGDRDAIEHLMQLYAIHQLFFENPSKEQINRYNRSLNIQWALDIKAQFPQDGEVERRSDNLEEWIGDIEDEDEQEQIQLWAKQVRKGKMTEAEFGERIKGYLN